MNLYVARMLKLVSAQALCRFDLPGICIQAKSGSCGLRRGSHWQTPGEREQAAGASHRQRCSSHSCQWQEGRGTLQDYGSKQSAVFSGRFEPAEYCRAAEFVKCG